MSIECRYEESIATVRYLQGIHRDLVGGGCVSVCDHNEFIMTRWIVSWALTQMAWLQGIRCTRVGGQLGPDMARVLGKNTS